MIDENTVGVKPINWLIDQEPIITWPGHSSVPLGVVLLIEFHCPNTLLHILVIA